MFSLLDEILDQYVVIRQKFTKVVVYTEMKKNTKNKNYLKEIQQKLSEIRDNYLEDSSKIMNLTSRLKMLSNFLDENMALSDEISEIVNKNLAEIRKGLYDEVEALKHIDGETVRPFEKDAENLIEKIHQLLNTVENKYKIKIFDMKDRERTQI